MQKNKPRLSHCLVLLKLTVVLPFAILIRGIQNSGMGECNTKEENVDVNAVKIFCIIAFSKFFTDKLIITKE